MLSVLSEVSLKMLRGHGKLPDYPGEDFPGSEKELSQLHAFGKMMPGDFGYRLLLRQKLFGLLPERVLNGVRVDGGVPAFELGVSAEEDGDPATDDVGQAGLRRQSAEEKAKYEGDSQRPKTHL